MPIELNFEDITQTTTKGISPGGVRPVVPGGALGGGVINWLGQVENLLQIINQIVMNYKDLRGNMQPEQQAQRGAPGPSFPYMSYIEPPTGRPAPLPPSAPPLDINAVLIDKARQIIVKLQSTGFADATVEDIYNSFKTITIKQLAGLLGVKDDTRPDE